MGTGAVGLGFSGFQTEGYSKDGGSRADLENRIAKLKDQREEYEKQKENAPSKSPEESSDLDGKINSLENRLNNLQNRLDKLKEKEKVEDGECETCKNRKYQDGSDDPGVSFKTASKVGPEGAEAAVRGHENEHVTRNQAKAEREGKEIVYQSVRIKRAICPECGRSYCSGGETTTVTRSKPKQDERFNVGLSDDTQKKGKLLNTAA